MPEFDISPDTEGHIQALTRNVRQGDVLGFGWIAHLVDGRMPLTQEAQSGEGAELFVARTSVDGVVVLTQSCDVVRKARDHPTIEVAALVRLDGVTRAEALRGFRPRFVNVPGAGDDYFADLSRVMTIEKSLLDGISVDRGCLTEHDEAAFSAAIGRRYTRPALPDTFNEAIGPLRERWKRRSGKESLEGWAFESISEIRVSAVPSWTAESSEVRFLAIIKSRALAHSKVSEDQWRTIVESWETLCIPTGPFQQFSIDVVALDELLADEYVSSSRLDLDHLS